MKALLIRGDPRALTLTENLFDLFSDEAINWDAASSIGKIAAATDVLTKTNYTVTKVCTRALCCMYERALMTVGHPVSRGSEVHEQVVATVDKELAGIIRCSTRNYFIDAELIISRSCGSDSPSRRVVVTHKGDT